MSNPSPYIEDAGAADFQQKVLEKSMEQPVLVDFWADWCGPCKMLMPVLASLADEYGGKFLLVKVNSDQNQELAVQYGVRSLPTVKVFKGGQPVDEFIGALPESQVREFLEKHIEHASDRATVEAVELWQRGETQAAIDLLQRTVEQGAANDSPAMMLAELLVKEERLDEAQALLDQMSRETRETPEFKRLVSRIEFKQKSRDVPDRSELEQRIEANPGDVEARAQLGALLVSEEAYEGAMQQYLEIVRRDRGYEDDLGRTSLLGVFNMLGNGDERVKRYRRQLAFALN